MRCLYRYHLSANPTKWSNTLKQFVAKLPTSCLSVFDHFAELALKWLRFCYFRSSLYLFFPAFPWVSFVMEDCFCLDNHLLHLLIKHNHCYLWVNNSFLKACVFIHYVKSVQKGVFLGSVFNLSTAKYGPEKAPYLDTFYTVTFVV